MKNSEFGSIPDQRISKEGLWISLEKPRGTHSIPGVGGLERHECSPRLPYLETRWCGDMVHLVIKALKASFIFHQFLNNRK